MFSVNFFAQIKDLRKSNLQLSVRIIEYRIFVFSKRFYDYQNFIFQELLVKKVLSNNVSDVYIYLWHVFQKPTEAHMYFVQDFKILNIYIFTQLSMKFKSNQEVMNHKSKHIFQKSTAETRFLFRFVSICYGCI